jgi:hypothetical protein
VGTRSTEQLNRYKERQHQIELAKARGEEHIGDIAFNSRNKGTTQKEYTSIDLEKSITEHGELLCFGTSDASKIFEIFSIYKDAEIACFRTF